MTGSVIIAGLVDRVKKTLQLHKRHSVHLLHVLYHHLPVVRFQVLVLRGLMGEPLGTRG